MRTPIFYPSGKATSKRTPRDLLDDGSSLREKKSLHHQSWQQLVLLMIPYELRGREIKERFVIYKLVITWRKALRFEFLAVIAGGKISDCDSIP